MLSPKPVRAGGPRLGKSSRGRWGTGTRSAQAEANTGAAPAPGPGNCDTSHHVKVETLAGRSGAPLQAHTTERCPRETKVQGDVLRVEIWDCHGGNRPTRSPCKGKLVRKTREQAPRRHLAGRAGEQESKGHAEAAGT